MTRFEGKSVLITGGASGIGAAVGRALTAEGANVVLADINPSDTVAELDVTNADAFAAIVKQVVDRHGQIDILFNNAGISVGGEIRDHLPEDWRNIIDVNVHGVIHGIQAAYPVMIEQGHGHIVNMASMAGLLPAQGMPAYVTSKHAVVGLSHAMRLEAAPLGVDVSVVCPGVIRTPILDNTPLRAVSEGNRKKAIQTMMPGQPTTSENAAGDILDGIVNNDMTIFVPRGMRKFHRLYRWFPNTVYKQLAETTRRLRALRD